MAVLRITPNLSTDTPGVLAAFYRDLLGLEVAMDMDFIVTLRSGAADAPSRQTPQVSCASEGGGGTPLPVLSVEVDDLDPVIAQAALMGTVPEYGPVHEPWGVRRLFLRDPAGHLINVLEHSE